MRAADDALESAPALHSTDPQDAAPSRHAAAMRAAQKALALHEQGATETTRPFEAMPNPNAFTERWLHGTPNVGWTTKVKRQLESTLESLEIDGEVLDISCRDTLCRLSFEVSTPEDLESLSRNAHLRDEERWLNIVRGHDSVTVDVLLEPGSDS